MKNLKEGDFVHINYIGKVKETKEIFDVTEEDLAKKENVFNPNLKYKPIPIIIGSGLIFKKIDDALKEMKVGEKKLIEISVQDGFGQRDPGLVKLIPLSVFKEKNIEAKPGNYVTINRLTGKIVSIDGGRVKVDFNHPLAGKDLEYEVEIKDEIKTPKEKIEAITSHYIGIEEDYLAIEIKEKEAEIILKKKIDVPSALKQRIADILLKWLDFEKIKFVDLYSK